MDFDLIVFDLDGVLVNTSFCHESAFDDLWRFVGVTGPPYEKIAGRTTIEVVQEYTRDLSPNRRLIDEWVNFKQQWARDCLAKKEIAFEDTFDCFRRLNERGQRLALGTGASRDTTVLLLRRFGWTEVFSTIVTGEDVVCGKPAPDVYIDAMLLEGVEPDRTLIVEDSYSGLSAAIASNAYTASVRSGFKVVSDRFVGAFPDIRAMLDEMDGKQR